MKIKYVYVTPVVKGGSVVLYCCIKDAEGVFQVTFQCLSSPLCVPAHLSALLIFYVLACSYRSFPK